LNERDNDGKPAAGPDGAWQPGVAHGRRGAIAACIADVGVIACERIGPVLNVLDRGSLPRAQFPEMENGRFIRFLTPISLLIRFRKGSGEAEPKVPQLQLDNEA
jgi:hypothetical protein